MKKVLLSAVALVAFTFANAQEEKPAGNGFSKGDAFVSGALTLGSSKTGDFKANAFEIAPKVGYFVSENIAVGASVGYSSLKYDNGVADATNSGLALGAFGRYYFTPANQFSLFAQLGFDYNTLDSEFDANSGTVYPDTFKTKEIGLGLSAGLNYFVSSNFSIEAGVAVLGYTSNDNGGNGADKTNTFAFGGDWRAVTFGVNYKF
ncbi:Probable outer membrane protein precursor [Flavobacterium indicum GPTSA100-9 = DSM 17447]|uniref:Probable outer membrane protein n=1 Tax=Flavobacterium indicum (strain DSM 17447 / CIP 109464 / GPTSA100-9) TaxID=1094466 RepID=H8XTC7_FLAIG|nr:outer membrane beta-barrel protein [Flavobacterium indicum]CCG52724.1 Probable outer membrane protein precursor [Flavobacterium indicum GPTSA100-9 = DSM 17447]